MKTSTARLFRSLEAYGDREGTEAQLDRTTEILRLAIDRMPRGEKSRFLQEAISLTKENRP